MTHCDELPKYETIKTELANLALLLTHDNACNASTFAVNNRITSKVHKAL